jgi:NADPH:quinone reductase-like Zn-dependent oxidoreductase
MRAIVIRSKGGPDVAGLLLTQMIKARVRIAHRYPLEGARQAHEDLEARRSTGKLLLIP